MSLKLDCNGSTVTAFLDGELDHHSTKSIREEIDESIERIKPKELTLDFKNVTFMDSSGIGLVMGRYRGMQQFDGKLNVKNASLHIRKVMKLAGLDRLANIE
jgi:stage II sporulation protein AA (anti-sigma F factor antagonist)